MKATFATNTKLETLTVVALSAKLSSGYCLFVRIWFRFVDIATDNMYIHLSFFSSRQHYEDWALFNDEERSSTLPVMARGNLITLTLILLVFSLYPASWLVLKTQNQLGAFFWLMHFTRLQVVNSAFFNCFGSFHGFWCFQYTFLRILYNSSLWFFSEGLGFIVFAIEIDSSQLNTPMRQV